MGKRKRRHRSSDDEDRERLRNRIEWLEEQILKQRDEKYANKRSNMRQRSGSRSRSKSHRRDRDEYDSPRSHRRHYRDGYRSDDESYDDYASSRDKDRRSRRSRSHRRERGYSYTNHASRRDHDRRSGSGSSSYHARNSRSESPERDVDSQVQTHSISPSSNPPGERDNNSGDEANVTQPDTQAVANTPVITIDTNAANAKPGTEEVSNETQETELEADVLKVFGERLRPERVLAPAVHSHLATLWLEIIEKGLPAEERKGFLKEISPPQNCSFIDPPRLNLEVKAALDSTIVKRDERIVEKQEKIAASIAGVGKVIDLLIKSNPADKKQYLEPLNGVAKLLADLQHDETSIRKSLILKNIRAPFRDTLKDLSSDEWLFGKEISEKIKAAKVLQQSSKDLKQPAKQSTDQGKNSKNLRGPPHQGQYRSNTYSRGGGYKQSHSNYSRNNNYSRGNGAASRGRNYRQIQEHRPAKKSN